MFVNLSAGSPGKLMLCYCLGNPLISDYSTYPKPETEVSYATK